MTHFAYPDVGLARLGVRGGERRHEIASTAAGAAGVPPASCRLRQAPAWRLQSLRAGRGIVVLGAQEEQNVGALLSVGQSGKVAILVPGTNTFGFSIMWLIFS